VTIGGIELVEKIKKGQFKMGNQKRIDILLGTEGVHLSNHLASAVLPPGHSVHVSKFAKNYWRNEPVHGELLIEMRIKSLGVSISLPQCTIFWSSGLILLALGWCPLFVVDLCGHNNFNLGEGFAMPWGMAVTMPCSVLAPSLL